MVVTHGVGRLVEPFSARAWEPAEIFGRCQARAAYFAQRGVGRHDRIFLHHGNTLEFFVDLLASWHLGACAVPVDGRLTPYEIAALAQAAGPKLSVWKESPPDATIRALLDLGIGVVTADEAAALAGARAPSSSLSSPDDEALILFTSGTTGKPKGVIHTHRSLGARWSSLRSFLGIETFRRTLCLLPTHFGHGLICNSLFPWLFGQDLYVLPPFRTDILAGLGTVIDQYAITFLSSVPTVWRLALKIAKPPEGSSLERVFCGSAPLSGALWRSVQQWTRAKEVMNAYGITETGSWLAGTTVANAVPEDGLIGEVWGGELVVLRTGDTAISPLSSERCRPNEDGYVWIKTPALMKGYLGREDLRAEVVLDGWFSTRDIGAVDERGYLYLRGRAREEINKSGQKIYPGDIDSVIERFDETVDVCAFGFSEPLQGEDVGVAVVLRSSSEEALIRLHQWTGRHLAVHQMPQRWYLLKELPRTSAGKVNRRDVADFCETLAPVPMAKLLRERAAP
ncbi:MAG TPA: class I adenylate-forming enzyme family protein [Candidatus Binatia bacterium]